MHTIEKDFTFCAAHYLRTVPLGHKCGRVHGHNYTVVLVLAGDTLNEHGFVREFCELDAFKAWLDGRFDHQLINEIPPFDLTEPSTELLAKHFYEVAKAMFSELVAVKVSETPKTWVSYSPTSGLYIEAVTS